MVSKSVGQRCSEGEDLMAERFKKRDGGEDREEREEDVRFD